jgi:hypothetical protein
MLRLIVNDDHVAQDPAGSGEWLWVFSVTEPNDIRFYSRNGSSPRLVEAQGEINSTKASLLDLLSSLNMPVSLSRRGAEGDKKSD